MKLTEAGQRSLLATWVQGLPAPQKWLGLLDATGTELIGGGYRRVQLVSDDWRGDRPLVSVEKVFGPALKQGWRISAVALYGSSGGSGPLGVESLDPPVVVQPGQQFRYTLKVS